jgi:hypothetical protein
LKLIHLTRTRATSKYATSATSQRSIRCTKRGGVMSFLGKFVIIFGVLMTHRVFFGLLAFMLWNLIAFIRKEDYDELD